MLGYWPYATHKRNVKKYIYICNISWKTKYFNIKFVFPQYKNTNHKINT